MLKTGLIYPLIMTDLYLLNFQTQSPILNYIDQWFYVWFMVHVEMQNQMLFGWKMGVVHITIQSHLILKPVWVGIHLFHPGWVWNKFLRRCILRPSDTSLMFYLNNICYALYAKNTVFMHCNLLISTKNVSFATPPSNWPILLCVVISVDRNRHLVH